MKKNLTTIFAIVFMLSGLAAQQDGWIEQDLSTSMSGNSLVDCDENLIIYTKSNSDVVYVFDMQLKTWTDIQFTSQQLFSTTIVDEHTAFAYTDQYILGYSAIQSSWDTLKYQGNVIDPTGISTRKGFGCAGKLAYFVTDANYFYVFDAELAQWQEYDYGIVLNASGNNNFWAADVYAGAILQRNGYDFAKNVVYSLITHSFTELDQGGWYYYPDRIMTGGYVASWSNGDNEARYIGYSAYTNEFKSVIFPSGYDVLIFENWMDHTTFELLNEIFVYSCGYIVGDELNRDVIRKSYSTKTGNWYTQNYDFNPNEISDGGGGKRGGSFSVSPYYIDDENQTVALWKFYGNTGTHIGEMPSLFKNAVFACGGKVALGAGDHNLWFHNFETASSKNRFYPPNDQVYFSQFFAAENYCVVFRVDNSTDIMQVLLYNADSDQLHEITANKKPGSFEQATKQLYSYAADGPTNEVIFYSEILDSVIVYQAADGNGGLTVLGFLAAYTSFSAPTVIFDAESAQFFEKDITLTSHSMGDSIIFVRSGDTELTAYNAISKKWITYETDQQLNGYHVGDVVGVGYSASFSKYWGYSANFDHFYPLVPEGSFVSPYSMVRGKTGVVIRTEKIYAFCPNAPDGIVEDYIYQKPVFTIAQNKPNPCDKQTTVSYELFSSAMVDLTILDAMGKPIHTLIHENQQTGKHSISCDTEELANGLYYLRITVKNQSQVRKMIVIH